MLFYDPMSEPCGHVPGVASFATYSPPSFCHACGVPFGWTETALESARAMADELEELTPEDREALKKTLPDLASDTPVAESRFKRLMQNAGQESLAAMRSVLTDVLSEAVRKSILGA